MRRSHLSGVAGLALFIALVALAPPALAALPRTYQVLTVRNPLVDSDTATATEGRFGVALLNSGDLNADGRDDIIVGTDEHGGAFAGVVFEISGADGSIIRRLNPPDAG